MKALLIVIFAVYVTTVTTMNVIRIETDNKSLKDDHNMAPFQNYELEEDKETPEQCSAKTKGAFSFYDYSVVIAMLAVSLKIGVFYGYFHKPSQSDSSDNMLGSKLGLFPVTLSLTTSFVTAIELLGNPAEMFFYGTQFALIGKRLVA